MVYRDYDEAQLRNKIEDLEQRIKELEEENERLKNPPLTEKRTPHNTPNDPIDLKDFADSARRYVEREIEAEERFKSAIKRNPEFFMSTKERKALKKQKKKNDDMEVIMEKWKKNKHHVLP